MAAPITPSRWFSIVFATRLIGSRRLRVAQEYQRFHLRFAQPRRAYPHSDIAISLIAQAKVTRAQSGVAKLLLARHPTALHQPEVTATLQTRAARRERLPLLRSPNQIDGAVQVLDDVKPRSNTTSASVCAAAEAM